MVNPHSSASPCGFNTSNGFIVIIVKSVNVKKCLLGVGSVLSRKRKI